MSIIAGIIASSTTKSLKPTSMAVKILVMSIITAALIFKKTLSSWIAFVLILTFSSGMMTLFIYASSLTPNEKSKPAPNKPLILLIIAVILTIPMPSQQKAKDTMKTFSSQMMLMMMTSLLIMTMLALAKHGHNPYQSVSSSFY